MTSSGPSGSRPPYHPGLQQVQVNGAAWIPQGWPVQPTAVWTGVQGVPYAAQNYGVVGFQPVQHVPFQNYVVPQPTGYGITGQGMTFSAVQAAPKQEIATQRSAVSGRRTAPKGRSGGMRLYRTRQEVEEDRRTEEIERMNRATVREPQTAAERQEVEEWIHQRRKNYPRQNAVAEEGTEGNSERAQALREILHKQQKLGVTGIAGTEGLCRRYGGNRPDTGRWNVKRPRTFPQETPPKRILQKVTRSSIPRKPMSLLEKLLYRETRRDKSYVLQSIRFLVENNFLQDLGKKPLVYPSDADVQAVPTNTPAPKPKSSSCSEDETDGGSSSSEDVSNDNT